METLTRRDACNLIVDAMSTKVKLEVSDLDSIVFGVNNDLQVRDFLMGLPKYFPMEDAIKFLTFMAAYTKGEEQAPFLAVLSLHVYETGNLPDSSALLLEAIKANPNYQLTQLLTRVISSGWPAQALATMRDDLADKVMVACYGTEGSELVKKADENG